MSTPNLLLPLVGVADFLVVVVSIFLYCRGRGRSCFKDFLHRRGRGWVHSSPIRSSKGRGMAKDDRGNEEEEGEMERKREVGEMKTDLLWLIGRD